MSRPEVQSNEAQMAEINVTASEIARARNHTSQAAKYLTEALKHAQANTYSKMLSAIQSGLSDLYLKAAIFRKRKRWLVVPRPLHKLRAIPPLFRNCCTG